MTTNSVVMSAPDFRNGVIRCRFAWRPASHNVRSSPKADLLRRLRSLSAPPGCRAHPGSALLCRRSRQVRSGEQFCTDLTHPSDLLDASSPALMRGKALARHAGQCLLWFIRYRCVQRQYHTISGIVSNGGLGPSLLLVASGNRIEVALLFIKTGASDNILPDRKLAHDPCLQVIRPFVLQVDTNIEHSGLDVWSLQDFLSCHRKLVDDDCWCARGSSKHQ